MAKNARTTKDGRKVFRLVVELPESLYQDIVRFRFNGRYETEAEAVRALLCAGIEDYSSLVPAD